MSRDRSFFSRSSADQPVERLLDIGFRQAHVDAAFEPQIPAALERPRYRGAKRRADGGVVVDNGQEIVAGALGALADQKRQAAITILDERLEHRAIGGDHAYGAVLLPQRKGLPLGDADLQAIRIKLQHRRVGDPGIGHQPRPRLVGIEEQQRGVPGHAGDGQDLFAADFLRPGERNGGDAKAGGVGGLVAGVLEPIDDIGDMAAGDGTIAERRNQQKNRTGDAKSAWRQPGDPHAAAVDPRPIRREPGDAIEPVAQRRKIEPPAQPIFPRARHGAAAHWKARQALPPLLPVAAPTASAVGRGVLHHPFHQLVEGDARMCSKLGHE